MLMATFRGAIHGYLGIDDDVLWSIVRDDVPKLLRQLEALRDSP